MFSELDETIKQILVHEGGMAPAEIEISFEIPNREWSAGIARPTINCYLFDIRENRELRQGGVQVERNGPNGTAARRRPPLRLDLTYLVTAWTRAVEDEHRLLWHALRTLMRFPTLPTGRLQGALGAHELPIYARVAQAESVLKSPGEFWTALENQLKPSLSYTITLAVDHDAVPAGPPVLTTSTSLRTIEVEGAGSADLRIGGVARDEAGEPVSGVELAIEGHGAPATSGADGRFTLRVPRAGEYTLVARAGERVVRSTISVPAPDYTVTIAPAGPPAARPRARRNKEGPGGA
ncbi:MAG: hypothetical protein OHK0015_43870 [Chloroflexi bacterium OHK40]